MTVENQYRVKAILRTFYGVPIGQKIADCEFGSENNQYFLSKVLSAENIQDAKLKGERRLVQVLGILTLHTGMTYEISNIYVDQLSGKQPYMHSGSVVIEAKRDLQLDKEKIEEIGRSIDIIDRLPSQKPSTKRIDKAINYFERGCYLQPTWHSEAFLNFYKAMELISNDFRNDFERAVTEQMTGKILGDLTEKELKEIATPKRLIQFTCEKLQISPTCDISRIIDLRNRFSAHARLEEVTVSREDFRTCKALAGKIILNYVNHIQTQK